MISIENLSEKFKELCENIVFENEEFITSTDEITKTLNKNYYELDKDGKSNMLVVGSCGRNTAIKSCSDIDLLFILPKEVYSRFDGYDGNGQSALLQEIKSCLQDRYPKTTIRGDGQVVVIEFSSYKIELVPGFKKDNGQFLYPDTNNGGSWKNTDPIAEQEECEKSDFSSHGIFSNFCHILRVWKNNVGFSFKGLLIDTLVHDLFVKNNNYSNKTNADYLQILKEVYKYLSEQSKEQVCWYALGSNQEISNDDHGAFIGKAKKALESIENSEDTNITLTKLLGFDFTDKEQNRKHPKDFDDTEEYIENKFKTDIKYNLQIDGKVMIKGVREYYISEKRPSLLSPILKNRKIEFFIKNTNCIEPYMIYWKVRNVGEEAERKNMIRGKIVKGESKHIEPTSFYGPHFVECYLVKDNVCVARDRIHVPIEK